MVMNCDVGATIALSLLMTTNATLFTDKYMKTVTKHLPHLISTFMFGCVLSAHNKRICYVVNVVLFVVLGVVAIRFSKH